MMAQSGAVPPVHPRRYRVDHYIGDPSNGVENAGMPPNRFVESDWEARDVSSFFFHIFKQIYLNKCLNQQF